jgi:hypothetical protein
MYLTVSVADPDQGLVLFDPWIQPMSFVPGKNFWSKILKFFVN